MFHAQATKKEGLLPISLTISNCDKDTFHVKKIRRLAPKVAKHTLYNLGVATLSKRKHSSNSHKKVIYVALGQKDAV